MHLKLYNKISHSLAWQLIIPSPKLNIVTCIKNLELQRGYPKEII